MRDGDESRAIWLGTRLRVFGIFGKTLSVTTRAACLLISQVTRLTSSVKGQAAAARYALLSISNYAALDIPLLP